MPRFQPGQKVSIPFTTGEAGAQERPINARVIRYVDDKVQVDTLLGFALVVPEEDVTASG